jgi:hypothetical protein
VRAGEIHSTQDYVGPALASRFQVLKNCVAWRQTSLRELILSRAKNVPKKLGAGPLEPFPEAGRAVEDGAAALITEDLFESSAGRPVLIVFDAVNPRIAAIAIEGRFGIRGQRFHVGIILS